jgi:hypothetical protein
VKAQDVLLNMLFSSEYIICLQIAASWPGASLPQRPPLTAGTIT